MGAEALTVTLTADTDLVLKSVIGSQTLAFVINFRMLLINWDVQTTELSII